MLVVKWAITMFYKTSFFFLGLPKYLVLHLYAGNNDCLYNAKVESKSILYLNFRRKRVRIKGST